MNRDEAIGRILSFWKAGLLSHEEVVEWADQVIAYSNTADYAITELALKGPARCYAMSSNDFPTGEPLSFLEEFSLRATMLDMSDASAVSDFVIWVSRTCLVHGKEIQRPEAQFGYTIQHYWDDCSDMPLAVSYVRKQLPELLLRVKSEATSIWSVYAHPERQAISEAG